jgi:hypothetical protein
MTASSTIKLSQGHGPSSQGKVPSPAGPSSAADAPTTTPEHPSRREQVAGTGRELHVQTPRERATVDLTAAAVCLEETEATLRSGGFPLAALKAGELRGLLVALAEQVRDA